MTPLAAHWMKELVASPKRGVVLWTDAAEKARATDFLTDIHCFEVTACVPVLNELSRVIEKASDALFEDFVFLPAPKTWIEWKDKETGKRIGVLLFTLEDPKEAAAILFWETGHTLIGSVNLHGDQIHLFTNMRKTPFDDYSDGVSNGLDFLLVSAHAFLMLINSPQIIGRSVHMPNAGLERRLLGAGVGKFPLHAWTSLKLEVNKPIDIEDGEPHEAHLTGRRALHFCRKHIRIRNGRLEYVSAHWRGDAALGIKRTKYEVKPARHWAQRTAIAIRKT